ncbi:MAG: hypothetical protein ACRENP_07650 [Longimicrobiales bacterium]
MTLRLLRLFAILIAVAAVLDPAIRTTRRTRPVIAVVAASPATDSLPSARVAEALSRRYEVIEAPYEGADATVLVGNHLPPSIGYATSPAFAVLEENDGPSIWLQSMAAPTRAHVESRVPIEVVANTAGAAGRTLQMTLRNDDREVDRVERAITSNAQSFPLPLAYVPGVAGATPLRVEASIIGARSTTADLMIDVVEQRWSVLFFDRRPSWMSTFVRRSLERDSRFVVNSRVITSRNVSTSAGRSPQRLGDAEMLDPVEVVVVGAPESLSESDVSGLETFMRRRGGTVVLLLDRRAPGPYERLTHVDQWSDATGSAPAPVAAETLDSVELRSATVTWPARMPAGAHALGVGRSTRQTDRPVIWQMSVGAGRLVVSGALDAWKYRDAATSLFDEFWRALIADAAQAAAPPVEAALQSVLAPGERADVLLTIRAATLSDATTARARISASLAGPDGPTQLRLWPDGPVGRVRGVVRAPTTPGTYRVHVAADAHQVDLPIIVANSVARPTRHEPDVVSAWAASRGGAAIPSSRLQDLPALLERSLRLSARRVTWHPMRNGWWILPFVLLLAAEWWGRRRRGLT